MRKVIVIILVAAVLAGGGYWYWGGRNVAEEAGVAVQAAAVEWRQDLKIVEAEGRAVYAKEYSVASQVPGRALSAGGAVGREVRKGETLVRLDATDLEMQLQQARAALATAEAELARVTAQGAEEEELEQVRASLRQLAAAQEYTQIQYERVKTLVAAGALPAENLDKLAMEKKSQAEEQVRLEAQLKLLQKGIKPEELAPLAARVEEARTGIAALEQQLKYTVIPSPAAGIILAKKVNAGEVVAAGYPLYRLGAKGTLVIRAEINEKYLWAVPAGTAVTVSADAWQGGEYPGQVVEIGPEAVSSPLAKAETYLPVKIKLDAPAPLVAGMSVSVSFPLRRQEGFLVIPQDTLVDKETALADEKGEVFLVEAGRLERRQVQLGLEGDGDTIEVRAGLQEAEQVVLKPADKLEAGQAVRVTP